MIKDLLLFLKSKNISFSNVTEENDLEDANVDIDSLGDNWHIQYSEMLQSMSLNYWDEKNGCMFFSEQMSIYRLTQMINLIKKAEKVGIEIFA